MSDEQFSLFMSFPSCSIVQTLPYENRCRYVKSSVECKDQANYFNYVEVLYCNLSPNSDTELVFSILVLMSMCCVMFLVLGITADRVFCPALRIFSKKLGMNEHLAGVTFLAIGNGSPDIIDCFSSVDQPDRILLSDLIGAGVYLTAMVAGLVYYYYPFRLQWNHILLDATFCILAGIYLDYAMVSGGSVTVLESLLMLSIYAVYLFIIILDQFLVKYSFRILQRRMRQPKYNTARNARKLENLRAEAEIDMTGHGSRTSMNARGSGNTSSEAGGPNKDLVDQLIDTVNPFNDDEWRHGGIILRTFVAVKSPVAVGLTLYMPMVDYDLPRQGWSKFLNCIQVASFPYFTLKILFPDMDYLGIKLPVYSLIITVPLALYVFATTRTDVQPEYHTFFAIYTMSGCCLLIYICSSESGNILYVLGIVTYSSTSFLSATLQAWGNSIGDFVSVLSMAHAGYPRMAIAACFAAPFFNSIVSMGGTFLLNSLTSETGEEKTAQGTQCENSVIFWLITLVSAILWSLATDFDARKSIGVFHFILYGVFLLYALLGETEWIETYMPEKSNLEAEAVRLQMEGD